MTLIDNGLMEFREKNRTFGFFMKKKSFLDGHSQPRLTSDAVGKSRFVYVIRVRVIPQCVLYH